MKHSTAVALIPNDRRHAISYGPPPSITETVETPFPPIPDASDFDDKSSFMAELNQWYERALEFTREHILPVPLGFFYHIPILPHILTPEEKIPRSFENRSMAKAFSVMKSPPFPENSCLLVTMTISGDIIDEEFLPCKGPRDEKIPMSAHFTMDNLWYTRLMPQKPYSQMFATYDEYRKSIQVWYQLVASYTVPHHASLFQDEFVIPVIENTIPPRPNITPSTDSTQKQSPSPVVQIEINLADLFKPPKHEPKTEYTDLQNKRLREWKAFGATTNITCRKYVRCNSSTFEKSELSGFGTLTALDASERIISPHARATLLRNITDQLTNNDSNMCKVLTDNLWAIRKLAILTSEFSDISTYYPQLVESDDFYPKLLACYASEQLLNAYTNQVYGNPTGTVFFSKYLHGIRSYLIGTPIKAHIVSIFHEGEDLFKLDTLFMLLAIDSVDVTSLLVSHGKNVSDLLIQTSMGNVSAFKQFTKGVLDCPRATTRFLVLLSRLEDKYIPCIPKGAETFIDLVCGCLNSSVEYPDIIYSTCWLLNLTNGLINNFDISFIRLLVSISKFIAWRLIPHKGSKTERDDIVQVTRLIVTQFFVVQDSQLLDSLYFLIIEGKQKTFLCDTMTAVTVLQCVCSHRNLDVYRSGLRLLSGYINSNQMFIESTRKIKGGVRILCDLLSSRHMDKLSEILSLVLTFCETKDKTQSQYQQFLDVLKESKFNISTVMNILDKATDTKYCSIIERFKVYFRLRPELLKAFETFDAKPLFASYTKRRRTATLMRNGKNSFFSAPV